MSERLTETAQPSTQQAKSQDDKSADPPPTEAPKSNVEKPQGNKRADPPPAEAPTSNVEKSQGDKGHDRAPAATAKDDVEKPVDNAWQSCWELMEEHDKHLVRRWKEEIEGLLILAGLFSAVVTAFIIEFYRLLRPDPADTTVVLLSQILAQMNSSAPRLPPVESLHDSAGHLSIPINALWFLSLAIALVVAAAGLVVKQWLLELANYRVDSPLQRVRMRQFRFDGLHNWGVGKIMSALSLLLQTGVIVFLAGLTVFLWHLQREAALLLTVFCGLGVTLFLLSVILPALFKQCPYRSPLSLLIVYLLLALEWSCLSAALLSGKLGSLALVIIQSSKVILHFWKDMLPTFCKETLPTFWKETLPTFWKEALPTFWKETLPTFWKETLPTFCKETLPTFWKETLSELWEETLPTFRDETIPELFQKARHKRHTLWTTMHTLSWTKRDQRSLDADIDLRCLKWLRDTVNNSKHVKTMLSCAATISPDVLSDCMAQILGVSFDHLDDQVYSFSLTEEASLALLNEIPGLIQTVGSRKEFSALSLKHLGLYDLESHKSTCVVQLFSIFGTLMVNVTTSTECYKLATSYLKALASFRYRLSYKKEDYFLKIAIATKRTMQSCLDTDVHLNTEDVQKMMDWASACETSLQQKNHRLESCQDDESFEDTRDVRTPDILWNILMVKAAGISLLSKEEVDASEYLCKVTTQIEEEVLQAFLQSICTFTVIDCRTLVNWATVQLNRLPAKSSPKSEKIIRIVQRIVHTVIEDIPTSRLERRDFDRLLESIAKFITVLPAQTLSPQKSKDFMQRVMPLASYTLYRYVMSFFDLFAESAEATPQNVHQDIQHTGNASERDVILTGSPTDNDTRTETGVRETEDSTSVKEIAHLLVTNGASANDGEHITPQDAAHSSKRELTRATIPAPEMSSPPVTAPEEGILEAVQGTPIMGATPSPVMTIPSRDKATASSPPDDSGSSLRSKKEKIPDPELGLSTPTLIAK